MAQFTCALLIALGLPLCTLINGLFYFVFLYKISDPFTTKKKKKKNGHSLTRRNIRWMTIKLSSISPRSP